MPTLLNPSGGIGVVLGGVIATKEGRLELGISGDLGMAVRLRIGDFFSFEMSNWGFGGSRCRGEDDHRRRGWRGQSVQVGRLTVRLELYLVILDPNRPLLHPTALTVWDYGFSLSSNSMEKLMLKWFCSRKNIIQKSLLSKHDSARELSCQLNNFPIKYLGAPLSTKCPNPCRSLQSGRSSRSWRHSLGLSWTKAATSSLSSQ